MAVMKKEKSICEAYRFQIKVILIFFFLVLLLQLLAIGVFYFYGNNILYNNIMWLFIVFLIFPATVFKTMNLTSVSSHYFWIITFLISTFYPLLILSVNLLHVNMTHWKVLFIFATIGITIFFHTFLSYLKGTKDFVSKNKKYIDIKHSIINILDTPKDTKASTQIILTAFFISFLMTVGLTILYFSLAGTLNNELFSHGVGLVIAIFGSVLMFPVVSIMIGMLFYYDYAIRRYEKEHNIKFRTNFILVEEHFKEFNEKRKRDGLKPKSLAWAFIRGNLIELMEEEEKRG